MSAAPPPVLLSLDTATDRIHAALDTGDAVRVLDLPGGAQASAALLPALSGLLRDAGRAWVDVGAIAFGKGPGAFTGLRTACSVAQGLALALACPVIAIDTLMAVAEDARQASPVPLGPGDILWVLQDARMAELYAGAFVWDGGQWQVHEAARLWPLDEPARRWAHQGPADPALRWAGNAGAACAEALAPILSRQWPSAAGAPSTGSGAAPFAAPRGAALATLARAAWQRGDTIDAALALPTYVRDKVAQTTAERAAQASRAPAPPAAPPASQTPPGDVAGKTHPA